MKYLGGKARIAKELSAFIAARHENRWLLVEPFMGGANMTEHLAPLFQHAICSDIVPDLALLYASLQSGWEPPAAVSEQEYLALKHAPPSAIRAFAGFGCAFGGDFFHGYAKDNRGDDYCGAAKRACMRLKPAAHNVEFLSGDYALFPAVRDAVVYCDPPYAATSGYSTGEFDHVRFWAVMRAWRAGGAHVYVSEYSAPSDWTCIWSKERRQGLRSAGETAGTVKTERLFA